MWTFSGRGPISRLSPRFVCACVMWCFQKAIIPAVDNPHCARTVCWMLSSCALSPPGQTISQITNFYLHDCNFNAKRLTVHLSACVLRSFLAHLVWIRSPDDIHLPDQHRASDNHRKHYYWQVDPGKFDVSDLYVLFEEDISP